jgi:LacI family transcriptional regulator
MDKLKHIATKAGVSTNTVLRVLRGQNKEVWPSAIRRAEEIRELARSIGYLPNGSARAIRRGSFNCISLVLSTTQGRSHLPPDLFNAIHDELAANSIRLIVAKLTDERLTSRDAVPTILRDWACDGLLLNYTDHIPPAMVNLLGHYRIPSIWLNSRQSSDCVYYDDFGGGMTATQKLIELGHRNIAYLDFVQERPEHNHYSRTDRLAGYVQAMKAARLTPFDVSRCKGIPVEKRLDWTRELLTGPNRPTGIVCYDAGDRVLYAAALAGLSVPKDLSIVTFSPRPPQPLARGEMFIGRDITTVRVPTDEAGRQAVRMLMKKIENPQKALQATVVRMELDAGETCGPVPA